MPNEHQDSSTLLDRITRRLIDFSARINKARLGKETIYQEKDNPSFSIPDDYHDALGYIYTYKKLGLLSNCGIIKYIRACELHFNTTIDLENLTINSEPLLTYEEYNSAIGVLAVDAMANPTWLPQKARGR